MEGYFSFFIQRRLAKMAIKQIEISFVYCKVQNGKILNEEKDLKYLKKKMNCSFRSETAAP
jgi:hypothetical protein